MGWEGLLGAAYIRNISFEKTILVFVLVSSCVGKDKDKEFVLKGLSNIATQNNTAKHHTYIYMVHYTQLLHKLNITKGKINLFFILTIVIEKPYYDITTDYNQRHHRCNICVYLIFELSCAKIIYCLRQ